MSFSKLAHKLLVGFSVIEEATSPLNGNIQVREDLLDKRSLVVGGLTQSGGRVEKLFQPIFGEIEALNLEIKNCLILGLGAGSFAKVLSRNFPVVEMVGVEIDPVIVEIGRRYFDLGGIKGLKIQIDDAVTVVGRTSLAGHFDLILVDCYLGDRFPEGLETEAFLKGVKNCVCKSGLVVFNRLSYGPKEWQVERFERKLRAIFSQVKAGKINGNKLFLCQKEGTNGLF